MARKRKSKPTSSKRNQRQKANASWQKYREDKQLGGEWETRPEGALTAEQVDPATQKEQPLPGLIGTAIRRGWAVPEEKKPQLVDELVGVMEDPEVSPMTKVKAYNALVSGDKTQYERDYPEEAAKAKGSNQVNVGVGVKVESTKDELRELLKLVDERYGTATAGTSSSGEGTVLANGEVLREADRDH